MVLCAFYSIFFVTYFRYLSVQLINLGPQELSDWQKPKAAPKKKDVKGKKTVEGKDEEEEEDEEEEHEETAEDSGANHDEVYIARPTAHPRGKSSGEDAGSSRKRKATGSASATAAAERRQKKLKGAGSGIQPTLPQMGFGAGKRYALFLLPSPFHSFHSN